MSRSIIIIISLFYSTFALAKSNYQIDLILFAHPQNTSNKLDLNSPMLPVNKSAISLKSDGNKSLKPYMLLPPSQSGLSDEYYLLSRKSHFQVLGQYSWRQASYNQDTVALSKISAKGWLLQGTLHVQQGNYYLFNADLQFSPPSNPNTSFTVSQKQRLKEGMVYYLDNPQIGMVVKIHKIA